MPVKVRRCQLERMKRPEAMTWIKKINPLQCDDPEWIKKLQSGEIKFVQKT